jgi:hypothetical protein
MGCCIGGYSDVLSLNIVPSESFTRHELPTVIGTPLVEEQMEKKLANVQEVRCIHWWRTVSRVLSGHCFARSHLSRFRTVEDLMCVCAGDYETVDHLIWHCEIFRLKRHRLIDALASLTPIRDLCALKKWCVKDLG